MRILFATTAPPWPSRRGYQLRAAGLAAGLAAEHEARLVALGPPSFPVLEAPAGLRMTVVPFPRKAVPGALVGSLGMPLQVALHHHRPFLREVERELADFRPDVVVPILSRLGFLALGNRAVPRVVDLVDSLALNMRSRARHQPWAAPLFAWEAWRMERWDRRIVRASAVTTVVAGRDRGAVVGTDEELAAKVEVVPLGLELPAVLPEPAGVSGAGPVILLSGNLGYFPTIEGALWFAREGWPRVRARLPAAEWWLAGARPAAAIRRLGRSEGVKIFADPADLGALRRRATVAIAPLRGGSGTPIKILEAFADGVPVVATSQAASGLDDLEGGELGLAPDGPAFAEKLVELLLDAPARKRQRERAFAWLRERHELGAVVRRFEEVLARAVGRSG